MNLIEHPVSLTKYATWTIILFGFWIALTGRFDVQTVIAGLCCALLVAWLTAAGSPGRSEIPVRNLAGLMLVPKYVFYFILELVQANIEVATLVLHPDLPIAPQVVRFKTPLKQPLSKVLLANSITLTPGTLTLDIDGQDFIVHALTDRAASNVSSWIMQHILLEMEERAGLHG